MDDQTAYTILITYQVGEGYSCEPLEQLQLQLAAYTQEEAVQQAKDALALNPDITRYVLNIIPGGTGVIRYQEKPAVLAKK